METKRPYSNEYAESVSTYYSDKGDMSNSDWMDRFTAIGHPMPEYKPSAWNNACIFGVQAPYYPPVRFTDDSIIPVVVRLAKTTTNETSTMDSNASIFDRLKRGLLGEKSDEPQVRVVRMPRSEYFKYFSGDLEEKRAWTEEELNEKFGKYQDVPSPKWIVTESNGKVFMEEKNDGA